MAKKRSKAKAIKVVKSLISNDLNKSAAARELGVTPQAVQKQVNENPLVRSALQDYMDELEKQGVDDKASVTILKDAFTAEKVEAIEDYTEDADGEPKENNGKISKTFVKVPDHAIRLKANEQYLKIKKLLQDSAPASGGKHIHFHLGEKADDELCEDIGSVLAALRGGKPRGASGSDSKSKD